MSPMAQLLVAQRNTKILLDVNEMLHRLIDTSGRDGAKEVYRGLIDALNEALAYESGQIVESVSAHPQFLAKSSIHSTEGR